MTSERTVPQRPLVLPIRTLHVEVIEGPDAGRTLTAPSDRISIGTAEGNDLVLRDPTVSRYHLELGRHPGGVRVLDHGSTNGVRCGPVLIEQAIVAPGTRLVVGGSTLLISDGETVAVPLHVEGALAGVRGETPIMRRLMAQVSRAARTDVPVLLVGESGTGKELVARAVHEVGARAREPFVTVDCGALSPMLVASELFGHERGAFTGAEQRHIGAFERADGGTVFLDEIGELPASVQPMLLGVLERQRFRRVGGRSDTAVDVRIVSATHRDLRAEVNAGTFRLDLYYRIAALSLPIPPLRERAEDIALLVEHFAREAGHDGPIASLVDAETMQQYRAYRWPGNVRELKNVIEATVALGEAPRLDALGAQRTEADPEGPPSSSLAAPTYKEARARVLARFEARYLRALLERTRGNVSRAAREGGIDRSHLIDLLRRHGIR